MNDKPIQSGHQPTKSEMEEVIAIEATPDEIAAAVLQGGVPRKDQNPDKK